MHPLIAIIVLTAAATAFFLRSSPTSVTRHAMATSPKLDTPVVIPDESRDLDDTVGNRHTTHSPCFGCFL